MKSDVVLDLERGDAVYSAGETVKGRVHVTLTQDVNVKAINLRFIGSGRAGWQERRAYTKGSAPVVSRKNTEVILDHGIVLLKKGTSTQRERASRASISPPSLCSLPLETEEGVTIPAGVHTYPFQYTLPSILPSSFEGKWGQIRYTIIVTLERPWKFDIERERDITVHDVLDLNDDPEAIRPIGGLGEFRPGLVCCGGEPVSTELRLRRRGYVAGENIPFHAEIENSSWKTLNARVALIQHVTFKAGDKLKKMTQTMTSLGRGDIPPGRTEVWDGDSLVVPPAVLPSSHTNKLIQIRYRVTLLLSYSSWADDYTLPVTVTIGTVALRKAVLAGHLVNLSQSTPRMSMGEFKLDVEGNPRLPLLGNQKSRQSTPTLQPGTADMVLARRRCSAAVVLERPRNRTRLNSESGASNLGLIEDTSGKVKRKAKSSLVITEEEATSNGEHGKNTKTNSSPHKGSKTRLNVPVT